MMKDKPITDASARVYVGNSVSRILRGEKASRSVRVVAGACIFWAVTLMRGCGLSERRFLLWVSRIWRRMEKEEQR